MFWWKSFSQKTIYDWLIFYIYLLGWKSSFQKTIFWGLKFFLYLFWWKGKNSKSDEKHTWAALVAIALFSNSFVLFPQDDLRISSLPALPKKIPFFQHAFMYIYQPPSKTQICSQNKKENPPFLFVLFFLF